MNRMSKALLLPGLLAFSGVWSAATYASLSPTDTIKETVAAVLSTLGDAGMDAESQRTEAIALITARFNFPGMSKRILATNWKKANDEQKAEFITLFTRILANTYWRRLKDYSKETVEYVGERIQNEKTARVRTLIVTSSNEIPVD